MLKDYLDHEEQHALELILRRHGVTDPELTKHLATLINWVRADERSRYALNAAADKPPYLLVLLSLMGLLTPAEKISP